MSVAHVRPSGEKMLLSLSLLSLGWAHLAVGALERARDTLQESLHL